jgi:ABC-type multidrug transport system fused ATPase/permease subunit
VVLLDDPLSAVDSHVGSLLFSNAIENALKGKNKGVVLGIVHHLKSHYCEILFIYFIV